MAKKILIITLIIWCLVFISHHVFVGSFAGPDSDLIIIITNFFALNAFSILLAIALYNYLSLLKNISYVLLSLLILVNIFYGLDKSYKFFYIWKVNKSIAICIKEYIKKHNEYPSDLTSSGLIEVDGFNKGRSKFKEFDYLEIKGNSAFEIYYPLSSDEGWVYISKTDSWGFSD